MAFDHPLSVGALTFAVLDTNTILSPRLSDVLFDLHGSCLYFPRWTTDIEAEFLQHWSEVVLAKSQAGRKLTWHDLTVVGANSFAHPRRPGE